MPFGISNAEWEKEKAKALMSERKKLVRRGAMMQIREEYAARRAKRTYGPFSEFARELGAFPARPLAYQSKKERPQKHSQPQRIAPQLPAFNPYISPRFDGIGRLISERPKAESKGRKIRVMIS